MNFAKRLFTMTLAIVMVLALAVPAFADDTHTITILESAEGRKYEAYQIFAGDVSQVGTDYVLSNIVWGD